MFAERLAAISLIGYRGSGKTTVGRLLAQRTQRPFVDTDELIVRLAGKTIAEIFQQEGEQRFRDLESRVVADLCDGQPRVVALGGGAILREENRRRIQSWGPVIWLRCRPERLAARLADDRQTAEQRPALTQLGTHEEITRVLAERQPIYESISTHQVQTDDKTPKWIVEWIVEQLRSEL